MVEQDIAGRGIRDPRLLAAFEAVPREEFVRKEDRADAYGDHPLPIGHGQTISQPYIVARMTEALKLAGEEKVLEIGTGSGYQAAILAHLAREVHTVERIPALYETAKERLARYPHVVCRLGDGTKGLPEHAPFDAILVAAQTPKVPRALLDQTAVGGRIVAPVGDRFHQELQLLTRTRFGWKKTSLEAVRFVPLVEGSP